MCAWWARALSDGPPFRCNGRHGRDPRSGGQAACAAAPAGRLPGERARLHRPRGEGELARAGTAGSARNWTGRERPGRYRRGGEAIPQVIGGGVAADLKDPRGGFVTVTDVRTSPD